jgi:multidrug efflux pump subunit AcrB
MQDAIEGVREIRRVDIIGALDREIQINVDMFKAATRRCEPGAILNQRLHLKTYYCFGRSAIG